ncbi:ATP-binding cassette domain-containing protein [Campylobacter sp. faydin G-24]|uniref:ATP-binding cassette domain-containing protein n=1 Tax=Campylobacter anatolicus TaxID=2829105 RepID=A0ABS5HIB6_9BACT|nr:ATP-binding cassette domain-containing protein [Campylobacter anatolicus]MBR8463873.1 ATP-binding cassette domain-containing protein [Campylobacter anatolicus]MBR8465938.1 ATP-binding cassette domain-containing protein [Campylobacter anatolicus]
MSVIIRGENITTSYGERIMHDNVSWSINEGEIYGFLGGSGSGKTTLMKTMMYLKAPDSGDIFFDGKNIWKSDTKTQKEIKLYSGTMFQFGALYSAMTILDNVGVLLSEYSKFTKRQIDEISMFWIQKVGLKKEVASLYPSELSGGMKKRAALARALVLSPKVLFLDEPNSGLDPVSSRQMDALVKDLRDSIGLSVVMVTHDADSIFDILDRFLIIENRKIAFEGTIAELEKFGHNPLEELFKTRKK